MPSLPQTASCSRRFQIYFILSDSRWCSVSGRRPPAVSYTHLDVYKRQNTHWPFSNSHTVNSLFLPRSLPMAFTVSPLWENALSRFRFQKVFIAPNVRTNDEIWFHVHNPAPDETSSNYLYYTIHFHLLQEFARPFTHFALLYNLVADVTCRQIWP